MIFSRTPLRVTLGGGGTDLASYYQHGGGFIFAMALNKYIYVQCHRPAFENRIIVNGTQLNDAEIGSHQMVRAALERHGITQQFELSSIGDISGGTGLGSSSCFLVGLLHALHTIKGAQPDADTLAEEACDVEINALARGIGKQDQYMAAHGGLTTLTIAPDGHVQATQIAIDPQTEAAFLRHTHIYYTGLRRDAAVVLSEQDTAMRQEGSRRHREVQESLDFIKELGQRILQAWQHGDLDGWGRMLDEHWQQKKRLSSRITWPTIDALYDTVRTRFGVTGGKVIGAGGGGFLMLYSPRDGRELEEFMLENRMPRLSYGIDRTGSRILKAA